MKNKHQVQMVGYKILSIKKQEGEKDNTPHH